MLQQIVPKGGLVGSVQKVLTVHYCTNEQLICFSLAGDGAVEGRSADAEVARRFRLVAVEPFESFESNLAGQFFRSTGTDRY